MKHFKSLIIFFSLSFLLSGSISLNSQCGISGLDISNVQCIENANYEFDLNFIITDAGLDSFNVYINDNFQGQYSPDDLPVHIINNFFSGFDSDVIKVVDVLNDDCFQKEEVSNPCGCAQFDFNYSKLNCTDSTFYILFDLKYYNTGDSFDIGMINSPFGTHAYTDLPVKIGPFYVADTTYLLFMADKSDFLCFLEAPISGISCPQCSIHDIDLISYECDDHFNKYMNFVFEYTNPQSKHYDIFVNNHFHESKPYLYKNIIDSTSLQDTFHIGPINVNCDSLFSIEIMDSENEECKSILKTDSICCDACEVGNIEIRDIEYLSNSSVKFILDFDYFRNRTDSFELTSSNGITEKYSLEDLPLHISNYPVGANQIDILTVCMDNGNCCNSVVLEFPECEIGELKFRHIQCTSDSTFEFVMNFNYVRNRTDSFELTSSNGWNVKYSLEDLPVHISNYPVSEGKHDTLSVCIDNGVCCRTGILESPNCDFYDCDIKDISYEISFDTIESYWITLNFNTSNTSDSFLIKGNGRNYGHFAYEDLPVKLGPYNCSDSIILEYVIRDLEVENCEHVIEPGLVTCPPNEIMDISVTSNYVLTYLMDSRTLKIDSKKMFSKNATLNVLNLYGQILKSYKLPEGIKNTILSLENYNTGLYFIKMKNGKDVIAKKVFIE